MSSTADPQSYQSSPWGSLGGARGGSPGVSPWGGQPRNNNPGWSAPPFWHPAGIGRPIIIAAVVFLLAAGHIGRMLFWPIALAGLVFMVASGRFGCRRRWRQANWGAPGGVQGQGNEAQGGNAWQSCMPWGRWMNWGGGGGGDHQQPPSSGNHAFDEYRAETLRRLEEEQKDFAGFLERLRFAKDKAEFDQFMADRRQAPRPPAPPEDQPHAT
jgi:Protein of unknown function (DUF2852)